MQRDALAVLWDAVKAAEAVQAFVRGTNYDAFLEDDLVRSAVVAGASGKPESAPRCARLADGPAGVTSGEAMTAARMTPPASIDLPADHRRLVLNILYAHLPASTKAWVFGSRATAGLGVIPTSIWRSMPAGD